MRSIFFVAVIVAGALSSSCNTMIGFGRDMRIGGEGLENAANKTRGGSDSGAPSGGTDTSGGAPVY